MSASIVSSFDFVECGIEAMIRVEYRGALDRAQPGRPCHPRRESRAARASCAAPGLLRHLRLLRLRRPASHRAPLEANDMHFALAAQTHRRSGHIVSHRFAALHIGGSVLGLHCIKRTNRRAGHIVRHVAAADYDDLLPTGSGVAVIEGAQKIHAVVNAGQVRRRADRACGPWAIRRRGRSPCIPARADS